MQGKLTARHLEKFNLLGSYRSKSFIARSALTAIFNNQTKGGFKHETFEHFLAAVRCFELCRLSGVYHVIR